MNIDSMYQEYRKTLDTLPASDNKRQLERVEKFTLDKYNSEILHLTGENLYLYRRISGSSIEEIVKNILFMPVHSVVKLSNAKTIENVYMREDKCIKYSVYDYFPTEGDVFVILYVSTPDSNAFIERQLSKHRDFAEYQARKFINKLQTNTINTDYVQRFEHLIMSNPCIKEKMDSLLIPVPSLKGKYIKTQLKSLPENQRPNIKAQLIARRRNDKDRKVAQKNIKFILHAIYPTIWK